MSTNDQTRRAILAGLGAAMLPACRRAAWSPPEHDPTARSQIKPYVPGSEAYATYEERWIASSCAQCPAACGIRVRVVEGRAVRIEGNLDNPINRGGIGVRGLSGLQTLYDPDRITQPLRRDGERFVPITWDVALSELAGALARTRDLAPDQLLVMSGLDRGFTHELLARFCRAFGSPNFVDGTPSHGATLERAMELSLGVRDLPAYGEEVGAMLSLEAGLFEDACRSTYFARIGAAMRRDRSRRARIFHAGPIFDLAAYNADRWFRIRPGTSGALALGLCRVLLREPYAHELVDPARGLAEFRALVAAYTPERVAEITGCEASIVGELARELWDRRPSLVIVDERSLAFTNGLETARAAIALSALLGSLENVHGGTRIAGAAPLAAWPEPNLDDVARVGLATRRLDGAGTQFPGARSVLETLPDAIVANPPAVALLFHSNPVYARAQPERWRDALGAVPLVASFSPVLDETVAAVADLVLPDHTYLERLEDATPIPGGVRAVVGVRSPAVVPQHDTRATADVVLELARRLGEPVANAFPWQSSRGAFEVRWLGLHAAARGTIVEASPRTFLDRLLERGFWADDHDPTPGHVELALPTAWSEPRWDGNAEQFPLVLVPYHPLGHADGSGANQPWLRNLSPRPKLGSWSFAATISPHDVPLGARTGDRVRVTSPYGSLVLPLHVDARMMRGVIAIPTGGGHTAYGRYARGFGVNVMELIAGVPAPETGASLWCTTRVRVEVVT